MNRISRSLWSIVRKLDQFTSCGQKRNIELKEGRRMNPIFLVFKSRSLEKRFQEYFYGKNISIRVAITSIFGSLIYMSFVFTNDWGILFQMIPDLIVGVWFFIFSVLCMIPCFVRRRCLFEIVFLLSCINITTRTGASDVYLESKRPIYHSPVKYGLLHFELAFLLLYRPRVVILLPCCIINSIIFTIYIIIIEAPQKRGLSLYLFSTVCYYINELLLYLLIFSINLSFRLNFLKIEKLNERNQKLQKQVSQTRSLLHNIIPEHFIDVISTKQNSSSSSIIFPVKDGIVFVSDLVDFTRISSECDCIRLTDVLNAHFCAFDILCVELGVTKIKSVGDSFEAYVSLDDINPEQILTKNLNCCLLGVGIIESVRRINEWKEISFSVRVGICGGKFYAVCMGKMGTSKLSFDIFGDTLRRCSDLEQTANPNSVHIDRSIHQLVQDYFIFNKKNNDDVLEGSANGSFPKLNSTFQCLECDEERNCEIHCDVETIPKFLLFRIDRGENVKLPFETNLEIAYQQRRFRLQSVIVHTGSGVRSGHYYCFVRNGEDSWLCCNDLSVDEVGTPHLMNEMDENGSRVVFVAYEEVV